MMYRLGLLAPAGAGAGVAIFLFGCIRINPAYCEGDRDGCTCDLLTHSCRAPDGGGDAGPPCQPASAATDCNGKVCRMGRCAPCASDGDCDDMGYGMGAACLGGSCVDAAKVAFVDCDLGAGACTSRNGSRNAPFCALQEGVNLGRPQVAMTARPCAYLPTLISNRMVTIWGRGAALRIADSSNGIEVRGAMAEATIRDLEISAAVGNPNAGHGVLVTGGASGHLIHCHIHDLPQADGIFADGAQQIEVSQSLVRSAHNWGIEVKDTPRYDIENSYILANGNTATNNSGGARFLGATTGMTRPRFVYNTVAKTLGPAGIGTGVQCESAQVSLENCLVPNDGITTAVPAFSCVIGPGTIAQVPAPMRNPNEIFVDFDRPQNTWQRCQGLHVDPTKPMAMADIVHKGISETMPSVDFDGDMRPDMPTPGADEPVIPCQ